MRSVLGLHWKDWCWSWNFSTLATWWEELTHLKRLWCWERLKAGEGDDRGWDGWMASPTQRTWVWLNSGSWWWTGRPVMLQSIQSQRVGHDWVTNTYLQYCGTFFFFFYCFLFDTIKYTQLLLYISSLSLTISNFSRKPGSFYWKRVLETKICAYFYVIVSFTFWKHPFS